jgi:hypothetical protein
MTDCEICRRYICDDPGRTVTFAAADLDTVAVRTCRACLTAIIGVMVYRWNETTAEQNAEVAEFMAVLGLELPERS